MHQRPVCLTKFGSIYEKLIKSKNLKMLALDKFL